MVNPIVASAAPADMFPMFRVRASSRETFFTSPVLSLTKTAGFTLSAIKNVAKRIVYLIVISHVVVKTVAIC